MKTNSFTKELEDLIAQQQTNLFKLAQEIIPNITADDLLQPFDFPELESNPYFRYEEGVLAGMLCALTVQKSIEFTDVNC